MALGHSGGAYATTDKSPNYLGEVAFNLGQISFRDRLQKKQEEEQKLQKEQAEKDSYGNPAFKFDITANRTINDVGVNHAIEAKQNFLKYKNLAMNEKDPYMKGKYIQAMENIKQSFGVASQIPEMINKRRADILKGLEMNKYDDQSAREALKKIDALGSGQAKLRFDEGGLLKMQLFDKDAPLSQEQDYTEFLNSIIPTDKSDFQAMLTKAVSEVGTDEITNNRGIYTYSTTAANKDKKEARYNVFEKEVLENDSNRQNFARLNGIDPNDETALKSKVKEFYESGFDTKSTQGVNTGLLNYNLSKKKYDDDVKDKKEKFNIVKKDTAVLGDDFIPDNNISRDGLLPKGYNLEKGIKIPQIGGEKGLQNAIVKSVFIDKKGNVIITGTADSKYTQTITQEGYKDSTKEVTKNGKFTRAASAQTLAEIAKARGFENEDEFKTDLYRLNDFKPNKTVTQKAKTIKQGGYTYTWNETTQQYE